jgi:hypothetical protein
VHQKHGHFGAIFASHEDLFRFVGAGIKIDLGLFPEAAFSTGDIVLINGTWSRETREDVMGELVGALTDKTTDGADAW